MHLIMCSGHLHVTSQYAVVLFGAVYRPRSRGDNTVGSVRVSVRLSVGTLLFEPFYL